METRGGKERETFPSGNRTQEMREGAGREASEHVSTPAPRSQEGAFPGGLMGNDALSH